MSSMTESAPLPASSSSSSSSSSYSSKKQKLPLPGPDFVSPSLVDSEMLSQGAEGKVYTCTYLTQAAVIKERQSKAYRVPALDAKINKQRLLQEARCMLKCRHAGVLTPTILLVDQQNFRLYMERIQGHTVKALLKRQLAASQGYTEQSLVWAREIGIAIGRMHDADIVHGDLTTSNIMIRDDAALPTTAPASTAASAVTTDTADSPVTVVLIDFGLGSTQNVAEDKAVDLYVLERAFLSTHPGSQGIVEAILESYKGSCKKGAVVLGRLEQVRMRGRKRDMCG